MNKKTLTIGAVVLVLAAAAVFFFPRLTAERLELPPSLGSLQLRQTYTGNEAGELINQMHGKGVTPKSNAIGLYSGAGGSATLYLSVYNEEREAVKVRNKMISGIQTGYTPFTDLERRTFEGHDISYCIGDGQAHYFFSTGTSLYWLAVDFQIAPPTLEALLASLRPQAIPT